MRVIESILHKAFQFLCGHPATLRCQCDDFGHAEIENDVFCCVDRQRTRRHGTIERVQRFFLTLPEDVGVDPER
ncbi:hypothetical protein AJ88_35305 [Mesorhizobium amorphae CCBAU 01583]|nr:hypothetical protein AJ88_35305 [Mesorhizobium amorphae CCBAU 01583]